MEMERERDADDDGGGKTNFLFKDLLLSKGNI